MFLYYLNHVDVLTWATFDLNVLQKWNRNKSKVRWTYYWRMRSPSNTTWLSSEALYNSHTHARLTNVLGEPVSNHSQIGTNYVIIWSGQGHRASLLFYSRYVTYLNDCFFIYVYVYFVLIMCKQYELIWIWRYNLYVRGDILSKTLVHLYYALLTWSPRQRDDTS